MLLRTDASESAFVSRGVTCGFLPAFWVLAWVVATVNTPVYRRVSDASQCLDLQASSAPPRRQDPQCPQRDRRGRRRAQHRRSQSHRRRAGSRQGRDLVVGDSTFRPDDQDQRISLSHRQFGQSHHRRIRAARAPLHPPSRRHGSVSPTRPSRPDRSPKERALASTAGPPIGPPRPNAAGPCRSAQTRPTWPHSATPARPRTHPPRPRWPARWPTRTGRISAMPAPR